MTMHTVKHVWGDRLKAVMIIHAVSRKWRDDHRYIVMCAGCSTVTNEYKQ
jgi:hypothetical protein